MKNYVTILGAVLLTVSAVQIASAGQRDNARKLERTQNQQVRDSNAYYAPSARGYRDDGYGTYNNRLDSLYSGGAISAPAGR